ncbi:IS21 family transposase [Desulfofustis glycolicus]|nr:IS21 family transposase [Desulfofustis glycolicus]
MDIISLQRQGFSQRDIAKKLGIHRNTVKKYLENPAVPAYHKSIKRASILDPYRQLIDDYLAEDDYKATWIHERLQQRGYEGSYRTVQAYVREVKDRRHRLAYTRFETEPGCQAQVDWGDFRIDNGNGSSSTRYLFLMVLGYSRAFYIEFVEACTLESFLDCHIRAFSYLHGVPGEVLYDNMKQVVVGRAGGAAVFNNEFLHFAHHYRFSPKACPPYSPWVKGKVERPIDYVRQRFWRGYRYTTMEKLNRDARSWLDVTANRRIHGTHKQPVDQRWHQEQDSLQPLPPAPYDTSLKVFRKVYKDCQLSYNANRYLVPHHVVGKTVMLKIKQGRISIYDDQTLLVTYQEANGTNQTVGNRLFYDQLRQDRDQLQRKYRTSKGAATRGLDNGSLFPEVTHRPLAEYEQYANGGASWNS